MYECPDHPGPLDDATDHVCRLRPVRFPAGGCVLRDKAMCALPYATCCNEGRAQRWWPAVEWPDGSDLQETYPGSGIYE